MQVTSGSIVAISTTRALRILTFLVLGDDRVAELDELSSADLVDCLNTEVVLSVGDEVFHVPAQLVLARHHVDVRPPASLTALHVHK